MMRRARNFGSVSLKDLAYIPRTERIVILSLLIAVLGTVIAIMVWPTN